jgi:1-acyl-sn-glycerol-3-phosphate acyltransferase
VYHLIKRWICPLLRVYHRMEVIHQERIPKEVGYVLIANHQTYMDPVYIGTILPHQPFFMAKQESFDHWILGRILRALQAFPVRRTENDIKAMKHSIRILKEGKVLGMFPEGGRRNEKHFDDLKLGSAFFATKTNRPVVRIYIAGAEKALPKQNGWPKPVKIRFYIGETLDPANYDDYKKMSEDINTTLLQLKDEARAK